MNRADDRRPKATSAYPRVLGRYHLLEELSENAIGVLHLARLEGPNGFQRWAAVRRVHPHLAGDAAFVRDFFEAARASASIRHPNVEATLDVGETDGTLWIALEYLHGERVAHLVSRAEIAETGVAWDVACRIVGQAALGLDAIHNSHDERGEPLELMHGPTTPRQIFVSYEGETKVLEACVPRRGSSTMSSDVLPYMAPEQVLEEPFDRRADVFALGVVLWELCAGRRLFLGDDDDQTRELIERHRVPRLETKIRGLPARVDEMIALALAIDPRHRYQTAQELALAIDEALALEKLVVTDYDAGRYMKALFADRFAAREERLHRAADATEIFSRAKLPSSIPPPSRRPSIPPPQMPPKKKIPEAPSTIRDVHETPTVEGISMDHYLGESNENPTSIMSDEERKLLVAEANPTKATTDENETAIHRPERSQSLEFIDSAEIHQVDHRTVHLDIDPDEEEEAPEAFYRTGETNIGPAPAPAGLPPPSIVRHASEEMYAVPSSRAPSPMTDEYNARMDRIPTVEINATPPPMSAVDAARMAHEGMLHIAPSSHPPGMYPAQMMPPPQPPIPMAAQTFMIQPKQPIDMQMFVWLFVLALALGCAAIAYDRFSRTSAASPTPTVETVPPATAVVPVPTASTSAANGSSVNPRDLPTSTGVIPSQARPPRVASHPGSRGGHPATTHTSAPSTPDPGNGSSSGAGSGFLTVICTPACDDVLDGSTSLGPSPVFKAQVKSGAHHITLKTSDPPVTKSITVTVPVDDTTVVKQAMGE